jgi:DNA-binding response OmpR family regulator
LSKILIIDDEPSIRTMMRLALEHSGYDVEVAEDGPSGIDRFGDGKEFDLVLLDQRMPGMHGIEVQRDLRRHDPDAKIVMTTAYGTFDLACRALEGGAADFLRKPFSADTLRLAVKSALERNGTEGKNSSASTFSRTTINGFRIELLTEIHDRHFGEVICTYKVYEPTGGESNVKVIVPQYVMELVKAHADTETVPCQNRFWQAMSEEALANYLWQEAQLPPDNKLKVADLTPALERWVDSIMTIGPEKGND